MTKREWMIIPPKDAASTATPTGCQSACRFNGQDGDDHVCREEARIKVIAVRVCHVEHGVRRPLCQAAAKSVPTQRHGGVLVESTEADVIEGEFRGLP